MDAADLQAGFRLGEWLVEPRESRISGPTGVVRLEQTDIALLLALVREHGEAVDRESLRRAAWPVDGGSDQLLRQGIRRLRETLGGSIRDRRYIVSAAQGGFALIAHCEPRVAAAAPSAAAHAAVPADAGSGLHAFLTELRRRNVHKVVGAYVVGMWAVLQVADVTFEPLELPGWWMKALTILAVVGLPIVTVLAWSYEITPGGIVLDSNRPAGMKLPRARRALAPALVAGVSLMAAVTGYAWWRTIGETADSVASTDRVLPDAQSIAVLPFVDMSPSDVAGYLGDGLSEELSSDLAKLPGMRVAARTSAFAFKGQDRDVRDIGQQLGVRYVLEGSVRRDGDRVRVTAQLIDASTGFHAWTESYDRPWQDLVQIQQDISGAIAQQLHSVITPELAQQLRRSPTADPRAYDFYLAGLSQLRRGEGMNQIAEATDLFRRSLEYDPKFARAQAGLCEAGILQYQRTNATEYVHDAEAACRAALEADATLKETELALARLYVISGRHEQAEAVYRSLLRRAPRDAEVHIGLGRALARTGRIEDAERSFREAIIVEPGYWTAHNALGTFLIERGRNAEAAEAFERVTELAPRNPFGFNNLGAARVAEGDLDGSAHAFEQSIAIEPSRSAYSNVGTLYYFLGRLEEAVTMYGKALEMAPDDFILWGGRADTLWFLPEQRERARQDYRRAAALAERALEVDATDAETWAALGFFYGRLGEPERSQRYVSRALELGPDIPYVHYYAAVAAADRGDREEAARLVRLALQHGYSKVLVSADPALRDIPLG